MLASRSSSSSTSSLDLGMDELVVIESARWRFSDSSEYRGNLSESEYRNSTGSVKNGSQPDIQKIHRPGQMRHLTVAGWSSSSNRRAGRNRWPRKKIASNAVKQKREESASSGFRRQRATIQAKGTTIPDLIHVISVISTQPYRRECALSLRDLLRATPTMCKAVLLVLGMNQRENEINTVFGRSADTLLHIATRRGFLDIVRLLVKYGADANARNSSGDTALHLACVASADDGSGPAVFAEIAHLLADKVIFVPNDAGNMPLHLASDFRIVEALLDRRAWGGDRNAAQETPLLTAVKRGNSRAVKVLLSRCRDTIELGDAKKRTPLHVAAMHGFRNIVIQLVNASAAVDCLNADNETPLYMAAKAGHHQTIELLLAAGANINALDEMGLSALILASTLGHKEVVAVLLKNQADVFVEVDGQIALDFAVQQEHNVVVGFLYEATVKQRVIPPSRVRSNYSFPSRSGSNSPSGSPRTPSRLQFPGMSKINLPSSVGTVGMRSKNTLVSP